MEQSSQTNGTTVQNTASVDDSYGNKEGTSNALILSSTNKKRKAPKEKKEHGEGGNAKKIEAKKRRLAQIEAKQSKSKAKKLAKIRERKQEKESRESLFESLQQYQLPAESMKNLSSTSRMQMKEKKLKICSESDQIVFPKKLNSLAGREIVAATIHNKPQQQENYYETDSESSEGTIDSDEETHQLKATTSTEKEQNMATTEDEQNSAVNETNSENFIESSVKLEEGERTPANDEKNADNVNSKSDVKSNSKEENLKKVENYLRRKENKCVGDDGKHHVLLSRTKEVELQRSKLPIYAEEQVIVEAINENTCVVISGETGSGKTTQIPQFLYEAGYTNGNKLIGVTEPRRVAAISMANRVAYEMNLKDTVSYQIRYEGNRSESTRILFMTDGVLMKELQNDIMLSAYSVIIIDEAHERSMYSDVLIGLLSRIAPIRSQTDSPLKLIIMSATLRISDFTQKILFPSEAPRILKIDSRQYPVTIHFERRTPNDYLHASFRKVCRIHETLPQGTVLVFLSGRLEVEALLKWLMKRYPMKRNFKNGQQRHSIDEKFTKNKRKQQQRKAIEAISLDNYKVDQGNDERNADLDEMGIADNVDDSEFEDLDLQEEVDDESLSLEPPPANTSPLYCLPLYSLLSSERQRKVFEPIPDGCRLCVIATNVAETSITIPGVRYVVDGGFEKRRVHDPVTGISQFIVHRISQASADQRAGRAGRVQSGHVYRLYSSAVFADLEKFSVPEILNKPVDQLVLHMKSMNIVKVANFPFPTRPDKDALEEAEKRLIRMGALEVGVKNKVKEARISVLGKTLSMFPLSPNFAKMLVMGNQSDLLPYVCTLVAILSVREPLIPLYSIRGETNEETQTKMLEALKQRRRWCAQGQAHRFGDLNVLMKAVLDCIAQKGNEEVCSKFGVRHKALMEISKLRQQLTNLINSSCHLKKTITIDPIMQAPSETQIRMLRQIVVSSLTDNIARRVDRLTSDEEIPKGAYECQRLKDYVFVDASSVLYKDEPDWILYQEIVQVNDKKCMQNVMTVESEWLPRLAEPFCEFNIVKDAEPVYDSEEDAIVVLNKCLFGDRKWPLKDVNRPLASSNLMLYRQFARFFLDGSVCDSLSEYGDKLLSPPTAMIKSWAKLQRRTENLLNALIEYEVTSRAKLVEVWQKRSEYLLDEYLEWLPQCYHEKVQLSWPPLERNKCKKVS